MKGRHKWSNWSEVFCLSPLQICLLCWQVGSPRPEREPGASIWRGSYYYEYRSGNNITDNQHRSVGSYGGLNGPGMNKKYDGNTLWSTFYCLEDMIHGALCTNISIDIIMPPLKCKFFFQAKREKQIFTFYNKIQIWLCLSPFSLSLFPLVFVLAEVSGRRNLAWAGLRGNQYCFIDHHFTQSSQWTLHFILRKILIVSGERGLGQVRKWWLLIV